MQKFTPADSMSYALNDDGALILRVTIGDLVSQTEAITKGNRIAIVFEPHTDTLLAHGLGDGMLDLVRRLRAAPDADHEVLDELRISNIPVVLLHNAAIRDLLNATIAPGGSPASFDRLLRTTMAALPQGEQDAMVAECADLAIAACRAQEAASTAQH